MPLPELVPLDRRPVFARLLLAVWRLHHLANGDDMVINVYPGQWPEGHPFEVGGVEVREDPHVEAPEAVMVLGRVGTSWRWAFNMAYEPLMGMSLDEVAATTVYGEVPAGGGVKLWLHPSPGTGEVPVWTVRRPSSRRGRGADL